MRDERASSAGTGVVIVALAVIMAFLCGGGALLATGTLFYLRASQVASPPPLKVPAVPVEAHVDVLGIEPDGTLLWNQEPVMKSELTRRLDDLHNASGPPRSIILRASDAPPGATEEIVRLLGDREVSFVVEQPR